MEPLCSQAHLSYTAFSHGSVNFLSVSHKCQIFQALPHYVLKPFQLSLFFLILNTSVLFFCIFVETSSLFIQSIYGILSFILWADISVASCFLSSGMTFSSRLWYIMILHNFPILFSFFLTTVSFSPVF